MILSNKFKTKTTLLKKVLTFFLPLLIVPIAMVVIFYYNYTNALIKNEVIRDATNDIEMISHALDIENYLKKEKQNKFPDIFILDISTNTIIKNMPYQENMGYIKKYIHNMLKTKNMALYHNKKYSFMIKPIVKNGKIAAFAVINYKHTIENKLANTNQTFLFIILIVVFIFFITVILSIIFAFQITNPIKEFIEGIRNISKKSKPHKINIVTDDEISILVEAFNNMMEQLSKSQLEITQFNETLQRKIEEEVQKNRQKDQQMLQQSRLAQMGEMISMIAHQWRQPLSAISSISASLEIRAQLNKLDQKDIIKLAENISKYSQHLSSTIDDFREFFKSHKEKKETTYNELVESALGIIEISITNKNIHLVKELHSTKVFFTYPNEIKQVILNLLKNTEDILIEKNISNPTITIKTYDNTLLVSDNGGGVPEDIIDKIFDPYFSTKTKKDGTGLGLYMSKTIIEQHCGGKLTVSNNAEGAVFKIEL